jgi:ADP-heptose:LPS heptosyltransferase
VTRPAVPARPLADPAVRRVALVRLRVGLGDLLCSVPALRALRAARPDVHVTVVTWPETAPALDRQRSYVDELLPFPGHPGIPERPPDPDGWAAFVAACRHRRFDLAVQAYGGQPAANEVTSAVGAARTAGFFTPGAAEVDLATHLPYPHRRHEVDRHLDLFRFLGVPGGSPHLEFPLTDADLEEARRLRDEAGAPAGGYVCVHPGATAATRRWLPARFAAVADGLARQGLRVLLTGVAAERPVVRAVADAMRADAADLCGRTTLGGLAALVRRSRLLVGNDTGTAHLAAALGVPSVTVFQAGDERRWAARDGRRHVAVSAPVGCRPCPHQRCPIDLRCATGVAVEDVLAPALRLADTAVPA